MDKKEATARLDAIEASMQSMKDEASKLREIIEAPEKWAPKKPTLCTVWGSGKSAITVIGAYIDRSPFDTTKRYKVNGNEVYWDHAKPLTRAEALALIDDGAASRYPWDKAPEWAMWAATDADGDMYWFQYMPSLDGESSVVWGEPSRDGACAYFGRDDRRCADFRDSLEQRPQEAK